MIDPTKDHKRVTPEGRALGEKMADLAERSVAWVATQGDPDERCKSCAFTRGTVPNGCIQTQMDVMKSVIEGVPFLCHQADRKGWPCHGWFAVTAALKQAEKTKGRLIDHVGPCPWEFSPPDIKEKNT
jgi:hypothetical protein